MLVGSLAVSFAFSSSLAVGAAPAGTSVRQRSATVKVRKRVPGKKPLRGGQAVRRSIARIDGWMRRREAAPVRAIERFRGFLAKVDHESGDQLLHHHPWRSNERGVFLTARHLRLPLRAVPPYSESASKTFADDVTAANGKEFVEPWFPDLIHEVDRDPPFLRKLAPEQIDWESVHSVLIVDFVTDQTNFERKDNVFFRTVRGKLTAMAIDNVSSFDFDTRWSNDANSLLTDLVRKKGQGFDAATRLSPRLQRGLASIDVRAWKADLRRSGLDPSKVDLAEGRLRLVQEHGLKAILPDLGD